MNRIIENADLMVPKPKKRLKDSPAVQRLQNAIKARKRGEEMHDDFLEWYYETHSRRKKTEKKANQDS